MAAATRSKEADRAQATQEDTKHLLEEVWNINPQDTFCKVFKREARRGMHVIVNLEKEDLENLF